MFLKNYGLKSLVLKIMISKSSLNFDLAFIAGAALVLIILIYFLSAEQIRTISYMLMLASYLLGRYVGKKISATSE